VSRQPDFSSVPRPSQVSHWEGLAVGAGLLALVVAGATAWRTQEDARVARARVAEVRRDVEAASARLQALEARRRAEMPALPAADAPPAGIVAGIASLLPADARLEGLSIDYAGGGSLELRVVARDAAAWDRLIERLERDPRVRDVEPGPETREGELRSLVRARWVGGVP
jgi:hypothetical protein